MSRICWLLLLFSPWVFPDASSSQAAPSADPSEENPVFFFTELSGETQARVEYRSPDGSERYLWEMYGALKRIGLGWGERFRFGFSFKGSYIRIRTRGLPREVRSPRYKYGIGYFLRYDLRAFHRIGWLTDTTHLSLFGKERDISYHPFIEFQHLLTNETITEERKTHLRDRLKEQIFRPGIGMRLRIGPHFYIRSSFEWFLFPESVEGPSNVIAPASYPGSLTPQPLVAGLGWRF